MTDWEQAGEKYPEHTKMSAINDRSQIIGQFLESLGEDGVVLAEWIKWDDYGEDRLIPCGVAIEKRLASYFDIDLNKIDAEKEVMLAGIRAQHNFD